MSSPVAPRESVELAEQFRPPVAETLEDTGLTSGLVEQLVSKILYLRSDTTGQELARHIGLRFSLIQPILDFFKRHRLVEVKHSLGMGDISSVFALTEAGRKHANTCLENNQYAGVAPVPLWQYTTAVRLQRLRGEWLTLDMLARAFRHMVISPRTLAHIGPAVSSGRSLLLYGQPGNGKTYLAEALGRMEQPHIFVPNAIEFQGNIIQLYDPLYHQPVDKLLQENSSALDVEPTYDARWVCCNRPFIVSGGELTLAMLDVTLHHSTKVYDAPLHLKANNGIYLVDDFGRQKVAPVELLNRWIVPMESRVDYLALGAGGKLEVPFECFLIFSTNLRPEQLGDEAFLRRIQYKMLVGNPDGDEFRRIFDGVCASTGLPCEPQTRDRFIEKHYRARNKPMRRSQPRDVISHAIDLVRFERLPFVLTDEVLDEAFESCFVDSAALDL